MKKNNVNSIVFGSIWVLDVVLLLVLILIPKDNDVFNNLYSLFLVSIFLIPLVLIFLQSYVQIKENEKKDNRPWISNIGCCLLILLNFVRFIATIKQSVVVEMITIMAVFVALELLIGYFVWSLKQYKSKKYILLSIATYASLVLFFFCAMIMSYDHSINW